MATTLADPALPRSTEESTPILQNAQPQFVIKNIGPIKIAEIELGDLTIIAGRNNTGKSYLVYTLYGFLKQLAGSFIPRVITHNRRRKQYSFLEKLEDVVQELRQNGAVTLEATQQELQNQRNELIKSYCRSFSEYGISQTFSLGTSTFASASIACKIPETIKFNVGDKVSIDLEQSDNITLEYQLGETIHIQCSARVARQRLLQELVLDLYTKFLLGSNFPSPFILSAERFGISLFYKELDFRRSQLVEQLQNLPQDSNSNQLHRPYLLQSYTSRYALPIKENIDFTRSLSDVSKRKSELSENELHKSIASMMDGSFATSGDDIIFASKKRRPDQKFRIPLHLASSSARGISDLHFFLRHVAKRNQLLIIDEPESHLDTANQIKMARLLARTVNLGVKVLITTHSDYIIKEINNLIMLSSVGAKEPSIYGSLDYDETDVISQNSVRAYVTENSSLTRCNIDELGMDMPVFDKTINEINSNAIDLSSHFYKE